MKAGRAARLPGRLLPPLLWLLLALLPRPLAAQSLDHYTLVMGWLPGQCLVDPDLAPCKDLSVRDPFGRDLHLIGLRPDARPDSVRLLSCDPMSVAFTEPVFPGEAAPSPACRLPPLDLSRKLEEELAALSPLHGQCAERQFWARHGSCSLLSQERYFRRAVDRAQEMKQSALNLAIGSAMGGEVGAEQLAAAFEQQFGVDSAQSLVLVCGLSKTGRRPVLTEVHVALTQVGTMRRLERNKLWHAGMMIAGNRCPGRFLIPAPGTADASAVPPGPAPDQAPPGVNPPKIETPGVETPTLAEPQMPVIGVPNLSQPPVAPAVAAPAPAVQPADPTKPQPMQSEPMHIEPVSP